MAAQVAALKGVLGDDFKPDGWAGFVVFDRWLYDTFFARYLIAMVHPDVDESAQSGLMTASVVPSLVAWVALCIAPLWLGGGFLAGDDLDVTLDEPAVRAKGSMLGAGGIMVFDDSRDMVEVAHSCMEFFAHESCGKCFPCRIGTKRLTERLGGEAGPGDLAAWAAEVQDMSEVMKATSACGLGMAAPLIADCLMRYWPERVAAHVADGA